MSAALAFVDIETTGLQPGYHDVWEVALILRVDGKDSEHVWQLAGVDLAHADYTALKIGRFYDRRLGAAELVAPDVFASGFARLTADAHIVGAVPSFDVAFLDKLLRRAHQCPGWKHRLICVENLVAGWQRTGVPQSLGDTATLLGVEVDESVRHTALGDAQLARDVYDLVVAS